MSTTTQQTATVIPVRMTFDLEARQWIAETLGQPAITVRAHAHPLARRRIRRLLEHATDGAVTLEERIELPPALARQLRAYRRRQALSRKLTVAVRQARMPLVYSLLDLQMNQADAASLIDVLPAQLGALLQRDTDSSRPIAREDRAAE